MAGAAAQVSYEDLYARWERGNWRATEIDFSQDRCDFEDLTDIQRRSMRWQFAMFFYGEDSVADNLSPYIDAAPREEQKYFLATQQADEARHAVLFSRFFREVLEEGGTIAAGLASCAPELGWAYRKTFARLDRMSEELRKDRSPPKFAQALVLYHVVIEAALAQSGQHFIEDYLTRMGRMPGFRSGIERVSQDEQRHIGFGVKVLSELFAESEECKAAAAELLREVMRYALTVFVPPGLDRRFTEEFGFTLEEIYAFGLRSFDSKMRAAGLPTEELPPGVLPIDLTLSPEDRAVKFLRMIDAGLVADPGVRPDSSPEAQRLLFDAVELSVDHGAVDGRPVLIQWRFPDAAPWYMRIEDGATWAELGEVTDPDVILESSWADWIRISVGRADPRRAMLSRRLRPRGSLRQLWRLQKIFPR